MLQKEMGYELDLSACAVCNSNEDLKYISPKTGRAVCYEHGNAYEHKFFYYQNSFWIFQNYLIERV